MTLKKFRLLATIKQTSRKKFLYLSQIFQQLSLTKSNIFVYNIFKVYYNDFFSLLYRTPSKSPFNARSTSGNIALSTVNQRKMVDFEDVVRLATEYQSEIRLKD
jgi:hypothetical protein